MGHRGGEHIAARGRKPAARPLSALVRMVSTDPTLAAPVVITDVDRGIRHIEDGHRREHAGAAIVTKWS
jgi:hypothetical protein